MGLVFLAKYLPNKLDIVIDDASHNLRDILITLPVLFKSIKSGGYYIIEDMDQFHVYKNLNPYKNELTPKEILLKIKNNVAFESTFLNESEKKYLIENIEEIKIEKGSMIIENRNISDIAFIKKNNYFFLIIQRTFFPYLKNRILSSNIVNGVNILSQIKIFNLEGYTSSLKKILFIKYKK